MLFPYEEVRKSQEELIQEIEQTINSKGRLIVNAPTGLGKTVSALGPAISYALKKDLTVWFLTNRHTQHQLAIETIKQIQKEYGLHFVCIDLIGKKGMCGQEVKELFSQEFNEFCRTVTEKKECEYFNRVRQKNQLTIEAKRRLEQLEKLGVFHLRELLDACLLDKLCGYELSLELGKKAKVIIGDYNYVFNQFIQLITFGKMNKELEKTILIVDEAHNLPKRIIEMLSLALTNHTLKNAITEARRYHQTEAKYWLVKINEILNELNNFDKTNSEEKLVAKSDFSEKVNKIKNYPDLVNELETIGDEIRKTSRKSYIGGVANFLAAWLGEDKGFTRIISQKEGSFGKTISLSYYCLDPSLASRPVLERVHSAVLMSGTLRPTTMYNEILGLKGKEKEYPNPFPPENKLTLIIPETTTKYTLRGEKMYQLIGQKCTEILSFIPGNCAVFFPSYQLRDKICLKIESSKKKFWEESKMNKEEKEKFLAEFKAEKREGGVLLGVMGGNFSEGIDLPGNFLNGVIIVGVPLSQPNLKTRETIAYFDQLYGKGWEYGYIYPAMNKCFQGAGRCIRSETDKGAIVFLDERFVWQNYFCCFPKEGLIVSKDLKKHLEPFFKNTTPE